jgi:hypothetical protein
MTPAVARAAMIQVATAAFETSGNDPLLKLNRYSAAARSGVAASIHDLTKTRAHRVAFRCSYLPLVEIDNNEDPIPDRHKFA